MPSDFGNFADGRDDKAKRQKLVALILLCLLWTFSFSELSGAAGAASAQNGENNLSRNLTVLYATTRFNDSPSGRPLYGGSRHLNIGAGSTEYGTISFLRPDDSASTTASKSFADLRAVMGQRDTYWKVASLGQISRLSDSEFFSKVKDFHGLICLYVHGYDMTFDEASREIAELADEYRRRNPSVPILPVFFSWPSPGNTADYTGDEANLDWSEKPFREFIDRLALEKSSDSYIDFVAHSMGSRYAFSYGSAKEMYPRPVFRNVILSCSDMDYHAAEQKKDDLQKVVERNLYVLTNDNDGPLITSQALHGQPRLGRPVDNGTQVRQSAGDLIGLSNNKLSTSDLLSKVTRGSKSKLLNQIAGVAEGYLSRGSNNGNSPRETSEVAGWLSANPMLSREWGPRARLIDTTGLVTLNMGHRLAWPLISGLILPEPTYSPFIVTSIHKRPDALLLKQMGGSPRYLYRWEKIDLSRLDR